MGFFKKKEKTQNEIFNEQASKTLDVYEEVVRMYSLLISKFLSMSDTDFKIINTWTMFSNGLNMEELVDLCKKFDFKTILVMGTVQEGSRSSLIQYVEGKYFLSMKILIEVFFGVLEGSDGLNILSDYLEENGFIDEDGMANFIFVKGGKPMIKEDCSRLYATLEYDEETRKPKDGT